MFLRYTCVFILILGQNTLHFSIKIVKFRLRGHRVQQRCDVHKY